jgi:hypothetical protein
MPRPPLHPLFFLVAVAALAGRPAAAVTLGQIDTFEDGTTQGWVVGIGSGQGGHPLPPANVPSNGPAGADDAFLLLNSVGGEQPGGRLTVLNLSQWTGDFAAAGVTAIAMDVLNLGNTDLSLRLLFEDPVAGPPSNVAASTVGVALPAGGSWTSVVFPIAPGDLTALMGTVEDALGGATVMRLFHASAIAFPGEPLVAQLGVDNVRAVPEPSATLLVACGLAALAGRRRA